MLLLSLSSLAWSASPAPSQPSTSFAESRYDPHFQAYAELFLRDLLPDDDWRWFKAQCIQESGPMLDPFALSPADALGVCQLIDDSATDAGIGPDERTDPMKNIMAGAFILRRCIRMWWPRDTIYQRLQLGQGCYNWGGGNMLKAQVRCDGAMLWEGLIPCAPAETIHYVDVIPRWYQRLVAEDDQ